MHRHGFKGRKFGRERDQRRALIKGLASNLVIYGSIETTVPKAKELVPYVEKLITTAKKGDLASRRLVISKMANTYSAHKLVDDIAPKLGKRTSGYLRIKTTNCRRGDNVQLARVSFVDDLQVASESTEPKAEEAKEVKPKKAVKAPAKSAAKKEDK
jgi:large subunit ribosomal protein L17